MCVCACVCVCVREREGGGERERACMCVGGWVGVTCDTFSPNCRGGLTTTPAGVPRP